MILGLLLPYEGKQQQCAWVLKFVFSGGRSATRQVKVIGRRPFPTDVSCGVSSVKSSNPVLGAGSGWGQHWHQQLRSILGWVERKAGIRIAPLQYERPPLGWRSDAL